MFDNQYLQTKKILHLILTFALFVSISTSIFPQADTNPRSQKKYQLSLDGGPIDYPKYSGAISFAFRKNQRWLWGLRLGFVWEDNLNSFQEIEIWDVFHADFFLRYYSSDYFYMDFGGSFLAHSPADETDEKRLFVGGYLSLSLGYKYIFFSPVIRLGYAGKEGFGIIFSPLTIKLQFQF